MNLICLKVDQDGATSRNSIQTSSNSLASSDHCQLNSKCKLTPNSTISRMFNKKLSIKFTKYLNSKSTSNFMIAKFYINLSSILIKMGPQAKTRDQLMNQIYLRRTCLHKFSHFSRRIKVFQINYKR